MGGPERPAADEAPDGLGSHDRRDDRSLPRLLIVERREDPRDRRGEHRLPGPGGADENEPVSPRQGDLERPSRLEEAAHVGEVRVLADRVLGRGLRKLRGDHLGPQPGPVSAHPAAAQRVGGLGERRGPDDLDSRHEPSLGEGSGGHHDACGPAPRERCHHRQDSRHRAYLPAQAKLPEQRPRPPRRHLFGADEDRDRDPEVQGRARLRNVRGSEVHRDAARRMNEPAVPQGPADALARLAERGIGETDDREAGKPRGHVGLDPDRAAVEAVERGGEDAGEHGPHRSGGRSSPDYAPLMRCPGAGCRTLVVGPSADGGRGGRRARGGPAIDRPGQVAKGAPKG